MASVADIQAQIKAIDAILQGDGPDVIVLHEHYMLLDNSRREADITHLRLTYRPTRSPRRTLRHVNTRRLNQTTLNHLIQMLTPARHN